MLNWSRATNGNQALMWPALFRRLLGPLAGAMYGGSGRPERDEMQI